MEVRVRRVSKRPEEPPGLNPFQLVRVGTWMVSQRPKGEPPEREKTQPWFFWA